MRLEIAPDVVAAGRDGDRESLESVLADAWPHAFRIAKAILRDESAAEDAAQEACATIYRTICTIRDPRSFRAWFYRIVVREALLHVTEASPNDTREPAVEDQSDLHAARLDVRSALAALPPVQRTAIVLHYYVGMNGNEIAAAIGIPAATVRFRLAQARRKMHAFLLGPGGYQPPVIHEVAL
jgi:RNA polymerase sigma-70 factor (ECF subfamily)